MQEGAYGMNTASRDTWIEFHWPFIVPSAICKSYPSLEGFRDLAETPEYSEIHINVRFRFSEKARSETKMSKITPAVNVKVIVSC